jgi:CRP-like cAMP-binding protein
MSITIDMFHNDAHMESFDTGQTIFQRGDQGEIMYVVTDGEVALSIGDHELERA